MRVNYIITIGYFLLIITISQAQINRGDLYGAYNVTYKEANQIDKPKNPLQIERIIFNEFQSKCLVLRPFQRVIIVDNSPINDLGLNIENPTIYGKFKIIEDTLVIKSKYSIQHFYKSAPKRRIKQKFEKVHYFKIISNGKLEINEYFFWEKVDSNPKNY